MLYATSGFSKKQIRKLSKFRRPTSVGNGDENRRPRVQKAGQTRIYIYIYIYIRRQYRKHKTTLKHKNIKTKTTSKIPGKYKTQMFLTPIPLAPKWISRRCPSLPSSISSPRSARPTQLAQLAQPRGSGTTLLRTYALRSLGKLRWGCQEGFTET